MVLGGAAVVVEGVESVDTEVVLVVKCGTGALPRTSVLN